MRVFLILFIFNLLIHSTEFITKEIIKKVEEKYGFFANRRFENLQKLILSLQNTNDIKKIETINDFFNNVSYSSDIDTYEKNDYWATPFEFLARGEGDCEDYAIAKYFSLLHLGIPSSKMFITYVSVEGYTQSHMVLTYFETPTSDPLVLDNFKTDLLPASKRADLKPIYYFNPEILNNGLKTIAHRKWDQLIKNLMENKL